MKTLLIAAIIIIDAVIVVAVLLFLVERRRKKDLFSAPEITPLKGPGKMKAMRFDSVQSPSEPLKCSLCGAQMLLKNPEKGEKSIYVCSNYPDCGNTGQHVSLRDTKLIRSILK